MNRKEGTDYFRDTLKSLFVAHGLTAISPNFWMGSRKVKKPWHISSQGNQGKLGS